MNDAAAFPVGLTVRKRDARVEPFNGAKVIACLRRVLFEENDADPVATAEGLADAVVRFLVRAKLGGPVPSAQLADLIEAVLIQTGHTGAGQLLRHHGRSRERHRRRLHIAHYKSSQRRYVNRRWNKSVVVAALERRHGLGPPAARQIAGQVETAVLRSGISLATTGLIDEMITSELLAWGLNDAALTVTRHRSRPSTARSRGAE